MTLSAVKKSVYESLGNEVGGLWKVVEAKLNVMQAVFLAIQTSPSLGEEILQKGLHIFQTLLNEHFTRTLEVPMWEGYNCINERYVLLIPFVVL